MVCNCNLKFKAQCPTSVSVRLLSCKADIAQLAMPCSLSKEAVLTLPSICSFRRRYADYNFQVKAAALLIQFIWQVFSKLEAQPDSEAWNEAPPDGRNPLLEPFWLQLLSVSWTPELGEAACFIIVAAARQQLGLKQACQALSTLFSSSRSLYAAAGLFSELAWQIHSRGFVLQVFSHVQEKQVCQDCQACKGNCCHHTAILCSQSYLAASLLVGSCRSFAVGSLISNLCSAAGQEID